MGDNKVHLDSGDNQLSESLRHNTAQKYSNAVKKKKWFQKRPEWGELPDSRFIIANYPDTELENNSISTTKYTLITFFPKNLYEQFSKIANLYFLLIGLLQMVKQISTSGGHPVIYAPLSLIIAISAIKDAFEDYKRKVDDNRENRSKTLRLTASGFQPCRWEDLRVGDVIKIQDGEFVPADTLLLKTSEENGSAFVETKNLDGETNLKQKSVDKALVSFFESEVDIWNKRVEVNFERPNPYLYQFNGNAKLQNGKEIPLTNNNFILRACSLRTQYVIGMVCYAGHYSKIMLNSINARPKSSKLERVMNKQIILVFILQQLWCILSAFYSVIWFAYNRDETESYLKQQTDGEYQSYLGYFLIKFGNWIIIFTNFVPISLLVTLEMVKFFQGKMVATDPKMKDDVIQSNTTVQTSRLMEEIGQVEYIFSDKTGTLTCNIMEFKNLSVFGDSYGDDRDADVSNKPNVTNVDFKDQSFFTALNQPSHTNHQAIQDNLLLLSTCHTINIETKNGEQKYSASSPDELALVNFAKFCGYRYVGTSNDGDIEVEVDGQSRVFKLLHVLEFNSDRKRMSVILKIGTEIVLFCKGADSLIMQRMDQEANAGHIEKVKQHLKDYANKGLRTLLLARRTIPEEVYNIWNDKYMQASCAIQQRDLLMSQHQEDIEKNLLVIGATAIEDKLQDQVGNTIFALKKAGIKVWVLTGDKTETAINIGFSCKLLDRNQKIYTIDVGNSQDYIKKVNEIKSEISQNGYGTKDRAYAIVITGETLLHCHTTELEDKFYEISKNAEVVIGCRVSPKQKKDVVEIVKSRVQNTVTLAIGDGANDVNMITAAHVGVGIRGLEGYQAARASDFAIGEFKLLRRLLFYYGRESYRKNSLLVLYNFWKNLILILPQFWYGFSNGMSGNALYESFLFQCYNIVFAALPIVIFAIKDKEFYGSYLMKYPKYYTPGIRDKFFNFRLFWYWFFSGVIQAIFICIFAFGAFNDTGLTSDGHMDGFFSSGMFAYNSLILLANLKILLFSNTFNIFVLFIVFGSYFSYVLLFFLTNLIQGGETYEEFAIIFNNAYFYLGTIITVVFTYVIDMGLTRYEYRDRLSGDEKGLKQLRKQSTMKAMRFGRKLSNDVDYNQTEESSKLVTLNTNKPSAHLSQTNEML